MSLYNKIKSAYEKYYYMRQRAKWMRKHKLPMDKYQIISLGCNCLSRALPTQWGLKADRSHGEKSCVFDLNYNSLPAIIHFLENDFADYFDGPFRHNNLGWFTDKIWREYHHETDCFTMDDFMARYVPRINNFREAIKTDKKIFFIYNTHDWGDDTPENLHKLNQITKKMCPNSLLIINTEFEKYLSFSDNGARLIYSPLPYPKYRWYEDAFRQTRVGYQYEKTMMDKIYEYITENINA